MPRPTLPRAKEITDIAKSLRDEGFTSVCFETRPDGCVSITAGTLPEKVSSVTPLEKWKASRGSS